MISDPLGTQLCSHGHKEQIWNTKRSPPSGVTAPMLSLTHTWTNKCWKFANCSITSQLKQNSGPSPSGAYLLTWAGR